MHVVAGLREPETDGDREIGRDVRPIGGLYGMSGPRFEGVPPHWAVYVSVADVDAMMGAADEAGKLLTVFVIIAIASWRSAGARTHLGDAEWQQVVAQLSVFTGR